jgi:hypothetical protein
MDMCFLYIKNINEEWSGSNHENNDEFTLAGAQAFE